jgi:hypothetical protein
VTEDGALGEEELLSFDAYLRETLLRISGAIQVLEELLSEKQSAEKSAAGHDGPQPAASQADEGLCFAGGRPAGSGREGQRRLEICQPLYLTWSAATGMLANVI